MSYNKPIRIVLFGCSGAGKSSVGNTLFGKEKFEAKSSAKSITLKCNTVEDMGASGKYLKIVDTPGLFDETNTNMLPEISKFFDNIKPGPHAILVVVMPNRVSPQDEHVFVELRKFFGDEEFLEHTIMIMNRRTEILKDSENKTIHQYVDDCASKEVQKMYRQCGKRIVAVENHQNFLKRKFEADKILAEIDNLDGVYSHPYFTLLHEHILIKIQKEQLMAETLKQKNEDEHLKERLAKLENTNTELKKKSNCNIL